MPGGVRHVTIAAMSRQFGRENPYHLPGTDPRQPLFFGRKALFAWLAEQLDTDPSAERFLCLVGQPGLGKTAVFTQLQQDSPLTNIQPLYLNWSELSTDSLGSLYWEVSKKIAAAVQLTLIPQAQFLGDPVTHFQTILQQAGQQIAPQRLLILGDEADALWRAMENGRLPDTFLNTWQSGCLAAPNVWNLWAFTHKRAELAQLPTYKLEPLSQESTVALIREPVSQTIVRDVTHYIYEVTRGHPGQVHELCYHLYDYLQKHQFNHLTVSDVAQIYQQMTSETAVALPPTDQPAYDIQTNPSVAEIIRPTTRFRPFSRQQLQIAGGVILLLLLLGIIVPNASRLPVLARAEESPTPLSAALINERLDEMPMPTVAQTVVVTATPERETAVVPPTTTPTLTATPSPTVTPTATPTPTPTRPRSSNGFVREADGMPMIRIPAGTFLMGSEENSFLSSYDEWPQREVTLDSFYIDQYEVSVQQYAAFLNRLGGYSRACDQVDCVLPRELAGYTSYLVQQDQGDGTVQYIPFEGYSNYPINHVSWFGANTYCQSVGGRLPTEAEWEYAARGTDGRLYPWGNTAPDETVAIFQSESYDNMKPVDALPDGASPFGVYGMAGSLWEWTADWYNEDYYREAPSNNPAGPETGFTRVIRGGAWPFNNQAERIRTANRYQFTPDFLSSTVGFRCALTP